MQKGRGDATGRRLALIKIGVVAAVVALSSVFSSASEAFQETSIVETPIQSGGFDRTYLLYAPRSLRPGAAAPLVIVLHGGGGKAAAVLTKYKWQAAADRYGFVVAAPQALEANGSSWNDHSGRNRVEVDDVAFISEIIDDVGKHVKIDPRRVFATGFSNGASMTQLLGARLSNRLAAVAPVTGHLFHEEAPKRALPVLMIFGAEDPRNPPQGGIAPGTTTLKPRQMANAEAWTRLMHCQATPAIDHPATGSPAARGQSATGTDLYSSGWWKALVTSGRAVSPQSAATTCWDPTARLSTIRR